MPSKLDEPSLPFHEEDYAIDPKDWLPALVLQADLELEMAEKRNHPLRRLSTWYSLIHIFKRLERERMVAVQPAPRDIKYHRAMIEFLIGSGAILVLELECHKQIDPSNIGLKFETVVAQLKELRDGLQEWHGDMTEARKREILDVFECKK